jgi:hypothetical protein
VGWGIGPPESRESRRSGHWLGKRFGLRRPAPAVLQAVPVEDPEKARDEEQDALVDRAGNRKQTDPRKPAERTWDAAIPGQEPDSPDSTADTSQGGRVGDHFRGNWV